jgi:HSP20 family molecular chaperone IbpA
VEFWLRQNSDGTRRQGRRRVPRLDGGAGFGYIYGNPLPFWKGKGRRPARGGVSRTLRAGFFEEERMKNANFMDLGSIFDEIFQAAEDFQEEFKERFERGGPWPNVGAFFNDNTDYYPAYSYPPANVIMTGDRSLIFEFALAGFDEKGINLSFQGDYMVFSAALNPAPDAGEGRQVETDVGENYRYLKHRLKLKDIDKQKYYVPLDKYAQDQVRAVYKNGVLRIRIPPKEEVEKDAGIKIEIVNED